MGKVAQGRMIDWFPHISSYFQIIIIIIQFIILINVYIVLNLEQIKLNNKFINFSINIFQSYVISYSKINCG